MCVHVRGCVCVCVCVCVVVCVVVWGSLVQAGLGLELGLGG